MLMGVISSRMTTSSIGNKKSLNGLVIIKMKSESLTVSQYYPSWKPMGDSEYIRLSFPPQSSKHQMREYFYRSTNRTYSHVPRQVPFTVWVVACHPSIVSLNSYLSHCDYEINVKCPNDLKEWCSIPWEEKNHCQDAIKLFW